jgi:hypothetical protein
MEHTPIPYPLVFFTFGLTVESIKEFGGASNIEINVCGYSYLDEE